MLVLYQLFNPLDVVAWSSDAVLTFSLRRALNSCSFLWVVSIWEKRAALPRTHGCSRASRTLRRLCGSRTISLLTCRRTNGHNRVKRTCPGTKLLQVEVNAAEVTSHSFSSYIARQSKESILSVQIPTPVSSHWGTMPSRSRWTHFSTSQSYLKQVQNQSATNKSSEKRSKGHFRSIRTSQWQVSSPPR